MFPRLLRAVFGSRNDRLLKTYSKTVARINALEPSVAALSDEALAAKTPELKSRLAQGATLDELLPEAFAVVREAAKRSLDMRHFDVQLVGGMVLHDGKIAEMRTGEGKTLVATLPAYLNALTGNGVHIVTVNDYLASRDAAWMGKIYQFLGMTVGTILSQMPHEEKHAAYAADITYGTNNEFGFDYLRDNMAMRVDERFQKRLNYAIVDEVDSILIDEARTPLIISGQAEDRTDVYLKMDSVAPLLKRQATAEGPGDFFVDEKNHTVLLSEAGHENAEQLLVRADLLPEGASLYEPAHVNLNHHLYQALRAHNLFFRDRHYVVQNARGDHRRRIHRAADARPPLVGRIAPGDRGERTGPDPEREPDARVDHLPELFPPLPEARRHDRHRGHRGLRVSGDLRPRGRGDPDAHADGPRSTGSTRSTRPSRRSTRRCSPTSRRARRADSRCWSGRPRSRSSERLAAMLQKRELPHQVLNAKQHAYEAQIIVQAGRPKMITIATNMAGRGTDIVLGGNVERQIDVVKADPTLGEADKAARIADLRAEWRDLHQASSGRRRAAHHRHRTPRVAAHRQPTPRSLGPPGRSGIEPLLSRRSTTRCCGSSPASASRASWSG